ncbi:MAG: DUF3857 domain-containing protein [Puniceicoccales bacterium]|jgi:hypothetical protein|nr:DUF3857 domain-containing protein [Puniceicoccales bacterium]
MKHFFIFTLALIFSCTGFAQSRDAEILHLQKDFRLNDDGSMSMHVRTSHRYNTHLGFDRLGEHFVIYNPRHQQLKIEEAYTVQKNGNVVKSPENAFNEVLPAFAVDAVAYNHLKEMVISFTGVELDAVSHLSYTLHSDAGYYPELDCNEALLQSFPVKEYVITVDVPAGKKLSQGLYNINATPDVKNGNGRVVYTWRFNDLPEVSKAAYQSADNLPRLIFSTWESQKAAMQWLSEKMKWTPSKSLERRIRGIEQTGHLERVLKAYSDFLDTMGASKVPAEYSGYRFRNTETILRSAYGTEAERTMALTQILQKLDKTTSQVAVYPKWFDGTIGSLSSIESFAVNLTVPGYNRAFYISPMVFRKTSLDIVNHGKKYFSINEGASLPAKAQAYNAAAVAAELVFSEKEISVTSDVTVTGALNPVLEIAKDVDSAKKLLTGKVVDVRLKGMSSPAKIDAKLTSTVSVKKNNGYFIAELPHIQGGVETWDLSKLGAKRQLPLSLPYPVTESYRFTLDIPKGKRVSTPEIQIKEENKIGTVSVSSKVVKGKLEIFRRITLKKSEIAPEEYGDFLELIHVWLNKNYRTVILADAESKK